MLAYLIWQRLDTGHCRRIVEARPPPTPLDPGGWSETFESKVLAEAGDSGDENEGKRYEQLAQITEISLKGMPNHQNITKMVPKIN